RTTSRLCFRPTARIWRFRSGRTTSGKRTGSLCSKSASRSGSPPSTAAPGERRMTQALVLYETDAKVGFVTLNRPEKLNALSTDLRRELAATLTRADEDPATSVVVLRGAGRSFCAGYDLAGGSAIEAWRHDSLKYHERPGPTPARAPVALYMRKPLPAPLHGRRPRSRPHPPH